MQWLVSYHASDPRLLSLCAGWSEIAPDHLIRRPGSNPTPRRVPNVAIVQGCAPPPALHGGQKPDKSQLLCWRQAGWESSCNPRDGMARCHSWSWTQGTRGQEQALISALSGRLGSLDSSETWEIYKSSDVSPRRIAKTVVFEHTRRSSLDKARCKS